LRCPLPTNTNLESELKALPWQAVEKPFLGPKILMFLVTTQVATTKNQQVISAATAGNCRNNRFFDGQNRFSAAC